MAQSEKREENPFEDPTVAEEWIRSVEGEQGMIRDNEIYPLLSRWASRIRGHNGRIVEVGSGQGVCSQHLGSFVGDYAGIEPSEHLVHRARTLYGEDKTRRFLLGNAYAVPVEDGSTDGAFSVTVWFHLANLQKASDELSRILVRNGGFLIITTNPKSYAVWKELYENPREKGKLLVGKVHTPVTPLRKNTLYRHTQNEVLTALKQSGLNTASVTTLGTLPKYPNTHLFISIEGKKQ